jgi:PAS domain S-box-containing protein
MRKIPLLPLRMRIFLPVLLFIIPVFVFAIVTLADQRQREKENILNAANRLARIIAIQEEDLIEATRVLLIATSHEPFIQKGRLDDNQKFLSTLLNQLGRYTNIEIADTTGNIISSAIPVTHITSISDRVYFRTVMKTGNFAVGEYQADSKIDKPTINFAYPIINESGLKMGAAIAVLDLVMLENLEKRIVMNLPEGSTLSKIDKNGKILVQYPGEHVGKEHPFSDFSKILDKARHGQGTVLTSDSLGTAYLNAYSQIESRLFPTGISLILSISEENIFREVNHAFYRNLLYLLVLGFIILLLAVIANELYLVRGLDTICNAALQLKGGDLKIRVKGIRGLIEVKQLAGTFNEMAVMIELRETERKKREDELLFRNTILFTQLETSIDGILVVDEDDKIVLNNRRFVEMWGLPPELVEQKDDEPVLQFVKNKVADQQLFIESVRYLYENKQETSHEEIVLKDDRIFERYTAPMMGKDDKYFGRIWYFHDITQLKRSEIELTQINRALRMLSNTNQALIHITNEDELLNEACRIIVEIGDYLSAWVCFAEDNEAKTLRPVAHVGFNSGYFDSTSLSWADNEQGQGPGAISIRSGQPYTVNQISTSHSAPWVDMAIESGYKSIATLPLICEEQTLGYLGIWSHLEDAFDTTEVEILKEMTGDLAFGINTLRTKEKKQQAEIAIQEHLEFQSMAFRFSPIAIIIIRAKDNIVVDINEFVTKNWGYTRDEMIGHSTEDLKIYANPADRATIIRKVQEEGLIKSFEFDICTKNKEIRNVICAITLVNIKGEKNFLTLLLDITERKKAEKALQASEIKYKIVADNTYNWEFWTDPNRNFIYCSPSCLRITGYNATEFIENPELKFEIVHPDFRSIYYEHVHQNYKEKTTNLQFKIIHKDGSERWIEHICQPVFDPDGNYMGQRGSNADITEKKEIDRKILSTVISTEESERNKFSQELHDGLGPTISTIKLYFQWLSESNDPEKKKKIIEIGLQNIEEAIMAVREISNNLSPRRLYNLGLISTLNYLIYQVNETGKLSIEFIYDNEQRYNAQIEITLYRIISELLNNTIKYSAAHNVVIKLSHNYDKNVIQITYTDDGKGFNFDKVLENKKGMGILNMMQRIETLQGFINFDTNEGKPLNVSIELPLINENQT